MFAIPPRVAPRSARRSFRWVSLHALLGLFAAALSLTPILAMSNSAEQRAQPQSDGAQSAPSQAPAAAPSREAEPAAAPSPAAKPAAAPSPAPSPSAEAVAAAQSPATAAARSSVRQGPVPQTQRRTVSAAPAPAAQTVTASSTKAHFTVNLKGSYGAATAAGFNVFDVAGSTSNPLGVKSKLNALPAGTKAMIWVGNLDNSSATPGFTLAQFKAQVNALASDSRVYGYFISDEPHPRKFPLAAAHVRERADYIRANAPGQKSFIVVADGTNNCGGPLGCEYAALAPSKTHVDLIGIDSYPCHLGAPCAYSKITERVNVAVKSGIPESAQVPVYQAFGQEGKTGAYYRTPTSAELTQMLDTWRAALPGAVLDYAYTWGTQTSAPQALSNHPNLVSVVKAHNGR